MEMRSKTELYDTISSAFADLADIERDEEIDNEELEEGILKEVMGRE